MRMPSVFIHGNSDDEGSNWEGFIVFWSTVNNDNNYENPGPVLEAGTVYHIQLDITQSHWGFSVDGQLMYEGDKDAHVTATTVPCYASFPDEDAADAVINNILITPGLYCVILLIEVQNSNRFPNLGFHCDMIDITRFPFHV